MALNFKDYIYLDIPEGSVKQITDSSGNIIWRRGYVNWVPRSTTNDGTTIYNGTGYKNGVRIRSGGAEGATGSGAATGFIKVNGGDIIRISGCSFGVVANENAINVADASYTNIGQVCAGYAAAGYGIFALGAAYQSYCYQNAVTQEKTGVWKWTVPPTASGVSYIRVSGYNQNGGHGSKLIVTVNEEIV